MFKKLRDLFRGSPQIPGQQFAAMTPQLRFSIPPDFEEHYRMAEISLDKLLADMEGSPLLVDLNKLEGSGPRKIRGLESYLAGNNGLMHMPAVIFNGQSAGIYHGFHRIAALKAMGVKVIPVLLSGETVPEAFLERYGVDKPYYKFTGRGKYNQYSLDGHDKIDVRIFEPIDRPAIMAIPGEYRKTEPPTAAEPPSSGSSHVQALREGNSGRESGPRKQAPDPSGEIPPLG